MSAARAWAAIALGVTLLSGGCTSGVRPTTPHTDPMRVLEMHRASRERVQSIQAEARVDQRGKQGRIRGTVMMFVQRPARVRFDVMTQFGPAAILTSDGERFAYSDLREKRYLHGETCPRNIARLIGIPMSVEETAVLLLGGTPVIEHVRAEIDWVDEHYRIDLTGRGGERQVVIFALVERDLKAPPEQQRLRLKRSEIFDGRGKSVWRARYDDYEPRAMGDVEIAMPQEVHVERPASDTDALVKFKEIRFEADIPAGAFQQQPRPGMLQEEAPCE